MRFLAMAVVLSLVTLSLVTGVAQSAEPGASTVGTWKLNVRDSIAPQGITFREYTVVVRRDDEILDFTYTAPLPDGKTYSFGYKGKPDGSIQPMEGGGKEAMTRLPSGNIEARLWSADGTLETKYCQLDASRNRNVCLATVTAPNGNTVFFKQVMDRQ
jgi:hypothetical protein